MIVFVSHTIKSLRFLVFLSLLTGSLTAQDRINYDLTNYKDQEGLKVTVLKNKLELTWEGKSAHFKILFMVQDGIPVISRLENSTNSVHWNLMEENLIPEYRIVSGVRRVTQQQTESIEKLGIPLTAKKIDEIKWDAFWDAPLYISDEPPLSHASSIPAEKPFANHPGMPRNFKEVSRTTAVYNVKKCRVLTEGTRIKIIFENVNAGIFAGYLQYDIYKGSNLVRQTLIAKTEETSVAFKYDAGLTGLSAHKGKMVWRDITNQWQSHVFNDYVNSEPVIIKSNNRLIAAELESGSITSFPPPHSFYWARESEQNLGYAWYRLDSNKEFSFGIRQAEHEEDPEFYHNFALYNARPGTWQKMPVFFYLSPGSGQEAVESTLKFTNSDKFKPLPGHKVMGAHYHVGLVKRLKKKGGLDQRINDVATMKAIGVNIYGVIDGARGPGRHDKGELFLKDLEEYYEAARSQSDENFLLMPNDENSTGGRPPFLGGHYDIIISKPLYWKPSRAAGQPLSEEHPKYGKVYNIGTPADLMSMAEIENVLISMPHPDTKRSSGFPQAIMDSAYFMHENYFGLGYRWGMGIDASASRLGEYRFLKIWDHTNNRMVKNGKSLKFALAISESRSDIGERGKPPYDDTYGMSPVNYLQLDHVPTIDDMSPIVNTLKAGNFFVTTGEVLIPSYQIKGEGNQKTIIADIMWTFPLDFVEIVWGDGEKTGSIIIPTSDLSSFGRKTFEIPFDAKGMKWVRFAAWDVATNGALVQPIRLKSVD
ncbi:CehA/McbA family metallohydrolase domain-containing protein [Marinigracilibium pacificum]|uniref:Uncharacterized protein n=1 Tax=Marinigracilibium pacificum TaxID=2729599 RepID=A0A848IZC4_9BACT|nr:hypothetical protein [Marinigracilibium pacificum]NMM47574.1 hypothetical protein [Marinigracilibium pacificum]